MHERSAPEITVTDVAPEFSGAAVGLEEAEPEEAEAALLLGSVVSSSASQESSSSFADSVGVGVGVSLEDSVVEDPKSVTAGPSQRPLHAC